MLELEDPAVRRGDPDAVTAIVPVVGSPGAPRIDVLGEETAIRVPKRLDRAVLMDHALDVPVPVSTQQRPPARGVLALDDPALEVDHEADRAPLGVSLAEETAVPVEGPAGDGAVGVLARDFVAAGVELSGRHAASRAHALGDAAVGAPEGSVARGRNP